MNCMKNFIIIITWKLNNWEINKLKKEWYDIHDLKPKTNWSKFDLFKDKNWEIYYKRKTWKWYSDPEYINLNINKF